MSATIAVSIFASVENYVAALCEDLRVQFAGNRPDWRHRRPGLERRLGIDFDQVGGFSDVQRARILNNCFKHNRGKVNEEFTRELGGNLDDEIEFENEDWSAMIDGLERFLVAVANHT